MHVNAKRLCFLSALLRFLHFYVLILKSGKGKKIKLLHKQKFYRVIFYILSCEFAILGLAELAVKTFYQEAFADDVVKAHCAKHS